MTSTHLTNGAKRQTLKQELISLMDALHEGLGNLVDTLDDLGSEDLDREEKEELYEQAEQEAGDIRTELAVLDVILPKLEKISPSNMGDGE